MGQNNLKGNMDLQSPRRMAIIKVWDAMFRGARQYVEEMGFVAIHNAPEIVGITGACENVDTLFKVDYFGQRAYLAQSDQLYLELITPYLKKVYAEIQSFRAEPDADDRHLTQFALFEIEHQGDLAELQKNLTGILKYAIQTVLDDCDAELQELGVTLKHHSLLTKMATGGFELPKITYTDAVEMLRTGGYPDLVWGDDLKAHHEALIAEWEGPCFITHYPLEIKFFNMREGRKAAVTTEHHGIIEDKSSPAYMDIVNSCDLILPFAGESAGAAERETNHDKIEHRLKTSDMYHRLIELGGTDEDFEWYLSAHKDKDIPLHSGAGIGMARVAQFILGTEDIRDAVPFLMNKENLL